MIVWGRSDGVRDSPAVGRALLLDRDGVVNLPPDGVFVLDYDRDFRFVPAFESSVSPFARAGIPIFVVSNQSCVGRRLLSREAAQAIMDRMVSDLQRRGIRIAGYAVCPHAPEAGCECRKPKPGLLLECARTFGVNLRASAFIGDAETDTQAGAAVNCATFTVDSNDERMYREGFAAAYRSIAATGAS